MIHPKDTPRTAIAITVAAMVAAILTIMPMSTTAQSSDKSNSGSSSATDDVLAHPSPDGIPIEKLIEAVARKDGRKYVLDPRVQTWIQVIGQSYSSVTSAQLQTILAVNGFIAREESGYWLIQPDATARQVGVPWYTGKETYPEAQIVTTVFHPKAVPASQLVPDR